MSRRIDIELTSALDDGAWTWRAAGAKQPKGTLDGSILPDGAKVGDELKVEVEQHMDGLSILSVVQGRQKSDKGDVLEILPSEREFQPVVETRAKRERGERRGGDGRGRRPRRDRDDRGRDGDNRRGDGERRGGGRNRRGPSFTPPPEVPQRPKPKRLRPGKAHRNEVLQELPEEQRPIAELALQGMPAVRQRLREENERATKDGRAPMPEASVLKLAEELLPRLRVAEWLDRAEAAKQQMAELDLRDLRSVVAAANDPMVARDDSTKELIDEMRAALVTKQEQELQLWFGDVDAALAVGRVVRALRLSSQPPKAGVVFPTEISQRLVDSTNASLAPMDSPDRWIAMLEAAAFSPIRSQVRPARKPDTVNDDLLATVKRLAPALPQVAELFEIEVDPKAPMPKPLRPGPNRKGKKQAAKQSARPAKQSAKGDQPKGRAPKADQPEQTGPAPTAPEEPATDAPAGEAPVEAAAEAPVEAAAEAPVEAAAEAPVEAAVESPAAEAPEADEPTVESSAADAAAEEPTEG
ncbi:MAG: hypothetical protein RIB65_01190 [Ilumatobacter fluminis]|uniref:hypothetical protein n=1 Tax=Ilumatobacter fluminis TaxID=467091 RepID=UPI0032EF61AB